MWSSGGGPGGLPGYSHHHEGKLKLNGVLWIVKNLFIVFFQFLLNIRLIFKFIEPFYLMHFKYSKISLTLPEYFSTIFPKYFPNIPEYFRPLQMRCGRRGGRTWHRKDCSNSESSFEVSSTSPDLLVKNVTPGNRIKKPAALKCI